MMDGVKQNIMECYILVSNNVAKLLEDSIFHIASVDFPDKWPELIVVI
jgi:hypothetical protein